MSGNRTWRITVRNDGEGAAHDLGLTSVTDVQETRRASSAAIRTGSVPVAASLAPGHSVATEVTVVGTRPLVVSVGADGGRTRARAVTRR